MKNITKALFLMTMLAFPIVAQAEDKAPVAAKPAAMAPAPTGSPASPTAMPPAGQPPMAAQPPMMMDQGNMAQPGMPMEPPFMMQDRKEFQEMKKMIAEIHAAVVKPADKK